MNKRMKLLAAGTCLAAVTLMSVGCGSTSNDSATKVGEVSQETNSETTETAETTAEAKTDYYVGDILMDGDVQIVYVASGEYTEDNDFLQPEDGNKYIFIKLAFENQGDSDTAISSLSFSCYADGYNAEQHYTDEDFSATLSAGRSTEGTVVFEVPQDAQEVEIEYETNWFTEEKINFIYEGDKDSGYINEGSLEASDSAFAVGDIVESNSLNISYISCENDTSYDSYYAPESGYHYVTLTFEFENKSDSDEFVSYFDFDCYADGKDCEMSYFRSDAISATISSGRKAQGTVTFLVPDEASVVEVEYLSNIWTSDRVIFTVAE